ncbi:hypothetical protein ONZ45_g18744 [Pleurotus djamor]|nr:hypothetical protein ONZ45_g18744 [Pleurotus djamor]
MSSQKKISPLVKFYLVTYNALSAIGWALVLAQTIIHVFDLDGASASYSSGFTGAASSRITQFLSSFPAFKNFSHSMANIETSLPPVLVPYYRRSLTTYARVGVLTAYVQSFAILEVVHVLFGFVRSPLPTTAMQVASRLFLVWGIVERFDVTRHHPLYTSMVFAWSATESIRYPFYACSLLGLEPYPLLYLRYTTFYILYPLGASSEAFLIWATVPHSFPMNIDLTSFQGVWDCARGVLFTIWWPGLYVMYTYMISQRRKVLRPQGQKLGGTPKHRKHE